MPVAAYGVSQAVLERIEGDDEADYFDWGGVGGTLAGNAMSLAATRATLAEVLTDEAFAGMTELATRYREGVQAAIDRHGRPGASSSWAPARSTTSTPSRPSAAVRPRR